MKKIISLFLLLITIILLTGCQKKYDKCLDACNENFISNVPVTRDDGSIGTVKNIQKGHSECKQSC
ncbi:MAG: hypothetical protein Q8L01_03385, partial [Candidatus Woesebacteria bacterium]|nr:hypothetical protein [Candidatus Woesebacteria bacterium]